MKFFFREVLNIIFPARCLSCRTIVTENGSLCHICWSNLSFITDPYCKICNFPFEYEVDKEAECGECLAYKPVYDKARSVFLYNQSSAKLISDLKYRDNMIGVKLYANLMFKAAGDLMDDVDFITAVPIHPRRLLQRKYNQSALLSQQIAIISGKKFIPFMLKRVKNTPAQASLNFKQRIKNVKGCFAMNKKYVNMPEGASVLIIDDVITTGSTINECAKILKKSGAGDVYVLTLAKTVKN